MFKGLKTNANYEGLGITVKHADKEGLFPLVKTSLKVLYFQNGDKVSKMSFDKLAEVHGLTEEVEPTLRGEQAAPVQDELVAGLKTNTDYTGQGIEVKHEKKGWMPLVKTTEKLLFVQDGDKTARMTLAMFAGVRGGEMGDEAEVPEAPLSEVNPEDIPGFDNDFAMAADEAEVKGNDEMYSE